MGADRVAEWDGRPGGVGRRAGWGGAAGREGGGVAGLVRAVSGRPRPGGVLAGWMRRGVVLTFIRPERLFNGLYGGVKNQLRIRVEL